MLNPAFATLETCYDMVLAEDASLPSSHVALSKESLKGASS